MKYTDILVDGSKPSWWAWKNFTPKEVSCKCCGEIWRDEDGTDPNVPPQWFIESMDSLQKLRDALGKPQAINCGHRCKKHNVEVGGVSNSQHYTHIAFDCPCMRSKQSSFGVLAKNAGFKFILPYPDRNFVHIDRRIGKPGY